MPLTIQDVAGTLASERHRPRTSGPANPWPAPGSTGRKNTLPVAGEERKRRRTGVEPLGPAAILAQVRRIRSYPRTCTYSEPSATPARRQPTAGRRQGEPRRQAPGMARIQGRGTSPLQL